MKEASKVERWLKRQCVDGSSGSSRTASENFHEQGGGALAGAQHLAAIMRLEAPSRLSLQDLYNLVEACGVLLADEVLRHVSTYIEPAMSTAPRIGGAATMH